MTGRKQRIKLALRRAASRGEFSMKTNSLHHLMLAAIMLASAGSGPVLAQPVVKWSPNRESVTITATASKNYRVILSNSHLGEAMMVSASIPVPYNDLDLTKDPGADEFGRRIHVAAHLICAELDRKYPPAQFTILEGFDCEHDAAVDGMEQANKIIASRRS
jgi:UrcA family protein